MSYGDKPLSENAVVSMYERDNSLALRDAFDGAVADAEERHGFKAKIGALMTKAGVGAKNASVAFYNGAKDKLHTFGTRFSVGYAAYQAMALRDKQSSVESKIAKYDAFLEKFGLTRKENEVATPIIEASAVEVEPVEAIATSMDSVDEIKIEEVKPEIAASAVESTVIDEEAHVEKVVDAEEIKAEPKVITLEDRRNALESAYRNGMAECIAALRDYLNAFDEKSASIEELEAVTGEIEAAGRYTKSMRDTVAKSRELPLVEYAEEPDSVSYEAE